VLPADSSTNAGPAGLNLSCETRRAICSAASTGWRRRHRRLDAAVDTTGSFAGCASGRSLLNCGTRMTNGARRFKAGECAVPLPITDSQRRGPASEGDREPWGKSPASPRFRRLRGIAARRNPFAFPVRKAAPLRDAFRVPPTVIESGSDVVCRGRPDRKIRLFPVGDSLRLEKNRPTCAAPGLTSITPSHNLQGFQFPRAGRSVPAHGRVKAAAPNDRPPPRVHAD
jgi:hypothetical protein